MVKEMELKKIMLPLKVEDVEGLHVGDMVKLSGELITGRDRLHKYLFHERPVREALPFKLDGAVLYHSGPIIKKANGGMKAIAAGPTTSIRLEMYESWLIEHYGIRGIMGKGGMGPKTLEALKRFGCVYLHTISGAASYLADRVKDIKAVWMAEEFGMAEAVWQIEVSEFPAFVTMDAHGRSLHEEIEKQSLQNLLALLAG